MDDLYNKFYCGDCAKVMEGFPDGCFDLVLTSPPYADQRAYGGDDGMIKPDEYVEWFADKAFQIYRILSNTGSFVLNINDKVVDGFQHLFVYELVIFLCQNVGFHLVRDYIWHNPATPPNVFSRGGYGRTKKSHEYCFWFSKSDAWTFNMDPIRKPYSKDMKRYLEGKGKGSREDNTRPSTHNFDCEKVWADNGGADPGSVLEIANTSSNDLFFRTCKEKGITHPARFPSKLAEFFILAGSNVGDAILDPFSGSGTTAVVAAKAGRRWVGIDMNQMYCDLAADRVSAELSAMEGGSKHVD